MRERLTYGMVGAGLDSFIGAVHRVAAGFDQVATLSAGNFSRDAAKNKECGDFYQLDTDRVYADFEEMAKAEGAREDKIDYVVISAPNNVHYKAAKAFLENGIHVFCEKPLCFELSEALELKKLAEDHKLLFMVNYSYSGNVMVKEIRELVKSGFVGDIIDVNAEYLQEYLVDDIGHSEEKMAKLSAWRKNPEISGISNCVGDIGSHVEHTVSYMTGLRVKRIAAKLDYFGQPLDMNANMLVEFDNGAHGVFCTSQVCIGHVNGLVVRIFGTEGAIEWHEEDPNIAYVTKKGQPTQIWQRGMAYNTPRAASLSRIPAGHPEGVYEAFANMYKAWNTAVLAKVNGIEIAESEMDFPTIDDGIWGMRFIQAAVKSSKKDAAWVELEEE